jgi:ADP-ribosyl-[dinitrogen reductase] hydrolase
MTAEAPAADCVRGAVFGMMIADALAMPVHWYYTPGTIERDFGEEGIQNYQAPVHPHPDAFAWSMPYDGSIEIFHGVQKHVRTIKPPPEDNPHYHFGLQAGDVTLQMQLARVLMKCLKTNGEEIKDWAMEFSSFMQTPSPALNNDIYRDVFIRRFFENLSKGQPLAKCPISQKECWSVGSMGGVIPALFTALTFAPTGYISILDCIAIQKKTHNSENVANAAKILSPLLVDLCRMEPPKDPSIYQGDPAEANLDPDAIDPRRMLILMAAKATSLPSVTGPSLLRRYNKARGPGNIPNDEMYALHTTMRDGVTFDPSLYMDVPDENVIGRKGFLGTVCYTEHGVPAVLYLAYKYFDDPVLALKRNTNLLGDSTSRGSLLGAILGAAHGQSAWPSEFVEGLRESAAIKEETDQFVSRIFG